jgi:hypothetical protein
MSGKLTALTYNTYTVRHVVTLKWLPIVFVRLIQSQRMVKITVQYGTAVSILPYFSHFSIRNLLYLLSNSYDKKTFF